MCGLKLCVSSALWCAAACCGWYTCLVCSGSSGHRFPLAGILKAGRRHLTSHISNRSFANGALGATWRPLAHPNWKKNTACKRQALPSCQTALQTTPRHPAAGALWARALRSLNSFQVLAYHPATLPATCCAWPASVCTVLGEEHLQAARGTVTPPSHRCHCCCCRAFTTPRSLNAKPWPPRLPPCLLHCCAWPASVCTASGKSICRSPAAP